MRLLTSPMPTCRACCLQVPTARLPSPASFHSPDACHRPHIPAPRHIGKYKGLSIPRVPSWNASEQHTRQKVGH